MTATEQTTTRPSRTRIVFDLADELTPEEIERFERKATEAGAESLTEHFLNIAFRLPKPQQPA